MLMKAIKLNYNMIKNGFQFSILLLIILAVIYYADVGGTVFPVLLNGVLAADFLWGINKMFGLTIFDREAELIQVLPVNRRTSVMAKVITGALWLSLILTVTVVFTGIKYSEANNPFGLGFLHKAALKLMSAGINEYLTGFVMALIPVLLFMASCLFCLGVFTLQLLINGPGTVPLKRPGVTTVTVVGSVFIAAVIIGGLVGINQVLSRSSHGLLLVVGITVLMLLLIVLLMGFCTRELDPRYSLG